MYGIFTYIYHEFEPNGYIGYTPKTAFPPLTLLVAMAIGTIRGNKLEQCLFLFAEMCTLP